MVTLNPWHTCSHSGGGWRIQVFLPRSWACQEGRPTMSICRERKKWILTSVLQPIQYIERNLQFLGGNGVPLKYFTYPISKPGLVPSSSNKWGPTTTDHNICHLWSYSYKAVLDDFAIILSDIILVKRLNRCLITMDDVVYFERAPSWGTCCLSVAMEYMNVRALAGIWCRRVATWYFKDSEWVRSSVSKFVTLLHN